MVSNANRVKSWVETKCVIESRIMGFEETDSGSSLPHFKIKYRYIYNGREYSSMQFNAVVDRYIKSMSTYKETKLFFEKNPYSPGSETVCFVNPNNPSEAVLEQKVDLGDFLTNIDYQIAVFGLSLIFFIGREQLGRNINIDYD